MIASRPFVPAAGLQECFNAFLPLVEQGKPKGTRKKKTTSRIRCAADATSQIINTGKKTIGLLVQKQVSTPKLPIVPFKPTSKGGSTLNPYPKYEPPKEAAEDSKQ